MKVGLQYARYAEPGAFDVISSGIDYDEGSYVEYNHVKMRCYVVMSKYNPLAGRVAASGEVDPGDLSGLVVVSEATLPAGDWPESVKAVYSDPDVKRVLAGPLGPSGSTSSSSQRARSSSAWVRGTSIPPSWSRSRSGVPS